MDGYTDLKSHNIVGKVICGEGAEVSLEVYHNWVKKLTNNF